MQVLRPLDMKLLARSAAPLLLLCCLATTARADPFYCAEAEEKSLSFQVLSPDKVLAVERCTALGGHAHYQKCVNVSVWQGSDRLSAQTLQPGFMITDRGSEWRVTSRGRRITWHRFCGSVYEDDPGPFCDDTWTFDERSGRSLSDEEHRALASFARLVASKRLDVRRVEAALSGLERDSATVDLDWSLRLRLEVAARLERDGMGALESRDLHWLEIRSSKGLEALVPLPRSDGEAYVRLANDVGSLLEQAGRADAAVQLLEPLVAAVPDRAAARLNLADALWKAGRRDESRPHYERYADWRRSQGESFPPRVIERIGDDGS